MSASAVKSVGFADDPNSRYRQSNEDAHMFLDEFAGRRDSAYFAIYDGHGGREAVEPVQRRLHELFAEELERANSSPRESFERAYSRMDSELESRRCLYVGSTAITCLVCRDAATGRRMLYTANAGDSRALLYRRGVGAVRLSYDHKASDEGEARRVNDNGGFIACKRVLGVLSISRAFGDFALKHVVISEPFTSAEELRDDDDTHLILACDGLFDVMSDEEVVRLVTEEDALREDAQAAAEALVKRALREGSTDNISVMVVRL